MAAFNLKPRAGLDGWANFAREVFDGVGWQAIRTLVAIPDTEHLVWGFQARPVQRLGSTTSFTEEFFYLDKTKASEENLTRKGHVSINGIPMLYFNYSSRMNDLESHLDPKSPTRYLHGRLVEQLGLAICGHELTTGTVVKTEEFEYKYKVSRSVVRETVRVLESMGLVSSTRRVGVLVLAPSYWNLYDPQVIRWRLASSARTAQLRSLTELRSAVEPEAARLAAIRAPRVDASELVILSRRMRIAGEVADLELFLELDVHFHQLVLKSSGNEMFAKLDTLVEEVLTGRTHYGLMPSHPHEEALQLHIEVADSIQKGAPELAHDSMLAIMQRTMREMDGIWRSSEI